MNGWDDLLLVGELIGLASFSDHQPSCGVQIGHNAQQTRIGEGSCLLLSALQTKMRNNGRQGFRYSSFIASALPAAGK
jgi:hypothetical protein